MNEDFALGGFVLAFAFVGTIAILFWQARKKQKQQEEKDLADFYKRCKKEGIYFDKYGFQINIGGSCPICKQIHEEQEKEREKVKYL